MQEHLTDKDLLTLAAKAAGHTIKFTWEGNDAGEAANYRETEVPSIRWEDSPTHYGYTDWNPLTDDGDEARLEAELRLHVRWGALAVEVFADGSDEKAELYAKHSGDKQAARRRAGVRAATDVGQANEAEQQAAAYKSALQRSRSR